MSSGARSGKQTRSDWNESKDELPEWWKQCDNYRTLNACAGSDYPPSTTAVVAETWLCCSSCSTEAWMYHQKHSCGEHSRGWQEAKDKEAAKTKDKNTRPKKRVQHAYRQRLELSAGRGGVCCLSEPIQGQTGLPLGGHCLRNPIPLRAKPVLCTELDENGTFRPSGLVPDHCNGKVRLSPVRTKRRGAERRGAERSGAGEDNPTKSVRRSGNSVNFRLAATGERSVNRCITLSIATHFIKLKRITNKQLVAAVTGS